MSSQFSGQFFAHIADVGLTDEDFIPHSSDSTPFVSMALLQLLESSQSVGLQTGWMGHHLVIYHQGQACAFLPLYIKSHSYGEYVFDHAWANAYHQHGLAYYPKLLCALPFTPVTANKLRICRGAKQHEAEILDFIEAFLVAQLGSYSSVHALFITESQAHLLNSAEWHIRRHVQFVFYNQDYLDFETFLNQLKSRKRKSIKKERAQVVASGVNIRRLVDKQICQQDMRDFYLCYQQTYLKRSGHHGYLTESFFENLLSQMMNSLMLVKAELNGQLIASALFFYDDKGLYGRYWGALHEISGLHFECCYYQGIEFTLERNLRLFNPGTQGEHKILRGFTPTYCYSAHKMAQPDFDKAVADFVAREDPHIQQYFADTHALLPYKVLQSMSND